jgi:HEAT repeat protein
LGEESEPATADQPTQQEQVQSLLATLDSDASLHDKAAACEKLAVIASKDAIPTLSVLLADEQLGHYARFALEPIPDRAVDETLRAALDRLEGKLLVGVINSIGKRKDTDAVERLSQLLAEGDTGVAAAAAAALGRIADTRSATILHRSLLSTTTVLRRSVADACLTCAQELASRGKQEEAALLYDALRMADVPKSIRLAATQGRILVGQSAGFPLLVEQLRADDEDFFGVALAAAREISDNGVTQPLLDELGDLPPRRQAHVLLALGDRGDKAALPAVVEAVKAASADVQVAAIHSFGQLAGASGVPVLLDAATKPQTAVAAAAHASLLAIPGTEVNEAILAALDESSGTRRRVVIDVVGDRRIRGALPTLMAAADNPETPIRLSALRALGEIVVFAELGVLTSRVISPTSSDELAAATAALKSACVRVPDREACAAELTARYEESPLEAKPVFLEILGTVGGTTALETVAAGARNENVELQDAATRILGGWMSVDAAPVLLDLAKTLESERFRIRSLRGYIRIIRQLRLEVEDKLVMCEEALQAAERSDEKILVLQAFHRLRVVESLPLVTPYLADEELKAEAIIALTRICERVVEKHPAEVAEALQKVLDSGVDEEQEKQVNELLQEAAKQQALLQDAAQ